uniref:Uncharacterized protein n=1 Tax=Saccharum spontaneum TaxID=62335 RepID=A0A678THV7_SACSP|nr:hypothetical protein SS31J13_000001 [Saccharum spontaneum]
MASSSLKPAAALVLQLRRAPPAAYAPLALLRRHIATSTTRLHGGDVDSDGRDSGGRVTDNPPPEMAPLPEDAPRQTPPRLGEPDPVSPPLPTTSKDKLGGATTEGGAPGGMPDTAVAVPPVSPDGSNV